MADGLNAQSRANLEGVHPDLVRVVERAINMTTVSFVVLEGVRSPEHHMRLLQVGASREPESRFLTGHAVALGACIDEEVRWHWPLCRQVFNAMRLASLEEGVLVRWGGNIDDEQWRDGTHFELPKGTYP